MLYPLSYEGGGSDMACLWRLADLAYPLEFPRHGFGTPGSCLDQ
jgi:hypothetical protein